MRLDLLLGAATLHLPQINYTTILPELIVFGGSLLLLAVAAMTPRQLPHGFYASVTSGIGIASLIASLILNNDVSAGGAFTSVAHSVDVDGFSTFILTLASCVLIVAPMLAAGPLQRYRIEGCEFYALACVSVGGAMLMGAANDLILIFLALEILSIPLYVLAGLDHRRDASGEAAMKYFLLGAFSSAIFVYGIALVYGATGSTNLADIAAFLAHNVIVSNGVLLGGMALLLVGFGFKIAAVPFHLWTPDVYQGSPSPAVGFMASIAKIGGFAALLRVMLSTFPSLASTWKPVIWVLAILTLGLGAVVALVQRDVKRVLAYSSVNHAGFVLLGLQAGTTRGVSSSLYYLFVYSLLVLGSFGVVSVIGGTGDTGHGLARYRGLARRRPVLATTFAMFLLAQAGAPFTTGFFSKLYVVEAAVSAHSYALAVVAMVSAAIAAFFYLRIVFLMFGEAPALGTPSVREEPAPVVAVASPVLPALAFSGGGLGVDLEPAFDLADAGPTDVLAAPEPGLPPIVELDGPESDPGEDLPPSETDLAVSPWTWTGLGLTLVPTLVFGVWPQPLIDFAHQATLLF
ncbi:MAG: proton-translocating NADH-quinone oxidoreductase, chain [Acidimicrobiaceae bacterium]|nr:proton-translocating NADH-quinone oxidoreductase, chain [Acidimicrobiaceae bacterium]